MKEPMQSFKDQKIIAIIPARYQSSRFPGKPLASILGKSLLQRTYENALCSNLFDSLHITTDDVRIFDHATSFGATAYMSSSSCINGTHRIAQTLQNNPILQKANIVVNVQGDHPTVSKETLFAILLQLMQDKTAVASTAATFIQNREDAISPNIVKCVFDIHQNALYFSRCSIPFSTSKNIPVYQHIGIYAYRTDFLLKYPDLQDTRWQKSEDLEQLKVLEHGYKMKVAIVQENVLGIDTPQDVIKMEKFL